jgi:aminopeptidase N
MNWRRLIIPAVALFVLLPVPPVLAAPSIRHYDLRLLLQPEIGGLAATSTLTIVLDGASKLLLHLAPQVRVENVTLAGHPTAYEWQGGELSVSVPPAMRREEVILTVDYAGVFRDPVPENPVHSEDPTYGVAATIGPGGTFLAGGAGWYPELSATRSTFRLRLEAPAGTEGITSGRLVERGSRDGRSYSVWESVAPLTSLTLAAGPYRIREEKAGDIPLYTYFYPETEALADTYLKAARGFLELYIGLFGPYPFEKFAIVENFFPTGYGFPSWTLLGSSVVRLPFIVETSLGHEIAHSWWGNGVRNAYAGGNWSEGLTTYVADQLYKERSGSEEGREYRLKLLRDYSSLVPPEKDFALRKFAGRRSATEQAVGYGKAAMVFHMARRRIGDQAFWEGLRTVARERMGQEASWDDFADRLGQAAGKDMKGFFRQWVDRPGAPVLRLVGVTTERADKSWRVSGTLVQEGQAYELRIPLRLESGSDRMETVLAAQSRNTPFSLEAPERPRRLTVDPEVDLFRRLDPAEIPPTVNAIRGSTALTVVMAAGLSPDMLAASQLLLAALRQDGSTVRREEETAPGDLRGRDVLFVGVPRRSGLLPHLPEGLQLAAGGFTLQGERFTGPGVVLFAALPHPLDTARTTALFLPFSAGAAEQAARKIPHYGKYSYLAFENGTNRAKGTWPPAASPVIHDFPPDGYRY